MAAWPRPTRKPTLHHILVRELIDGTAGLAAGRSNLPPGDQATWQAHRDRVERAAREAASGSSG